MAMASLGNITSEVLSMANPNLAERSLNMKACNNTKLNFGKRRRGPDVEDGIR